MTGELRALTGARGVAAWLVVVFHIRAALDLPDAVNAVLAKGYLAVDFFFLLSGFVIWLSYADRIAAQRWQAVPSFLLRRVARIWPLHLVMLGFALLIVLALHVTGRPADPRFPLDALPLHILLLQNWPLPQQMFGITSLDWNDPAWSISSEMFAYLVFPLLALAVDWRRLSTPVLLGVIVVLLAVLAYVMRSRGMLTLGQAIPYFGQLRCVTEFAAGTVIAALWLRVRERPASALTAASAIVLFGLGASASGWINEIVVVPATLAALLLILALTANAPRNPLGGRIVHYLGEISFSTYLGHSLLWKAFKLGFVAAPGTMSPALAIIFIGIVLAASVALYHLVERPAQRWINARGARVSRPVRRPVLPPAPR